VGDIHLWLSAGEISVSRCEMASSRLAHDVRVSLGMEETTDLDPLSWSIRDFPSPTLPNRGSLTFDRRVQALKQALPLILHLQESG
jgi:hypothetical protein